MGLLDDFSQFVKTPEGQGLLSAAFGGMATANRGQPINSLGKAGLAGVMGYGNALERQDKLAEQAMANKLRDMQISEYQRKVKQQELQQAALAGLPEEQRQAVLMGVPIQDIWKRNNPESGPYTLTPGSRRYGKDNNLIAEVPIERKLPEGMQLNEAGQLVEVPGYVQMKSKIAAAGRAPDVPKQLVPYMDNGQALWGTALDARGKPAANYNPMVQGEIAGAKAGASESAKDKVEAASQLPKAIANGENALRMSDELLKHPGFKQAVGASSLLGIQKIPGTDAKDFMNRMDQIKGGAFLTAFETLKGGGQITEVEGKKATEAIARMDNATSEGEFVKAVRDYQSVIRKAVNNAKMRAGNKAKQPENDDPLGLR